MPSVPGQCALFAMDRRWRRPHLVAAASYLPTVEAALLDAFFAGRPTAWLADQRTTRGAAAVPLCTLLTWVGGRQPILERNVRSLAAMTSVGTAATRSMADFLDQHELLDAEQLRETTRLRPIPSPGPGQCRRPTSNGVPPCLLSSADTGSGARPMRHQ
ncbi:hypothetical protein ACWDBC_24180 [Streptomyces parvus]|uniref:hypothetical protein n=1 Tax=Streptomyces parvus TaxID=66428 RepID=UPI003331E306